MPKLLRVDDVAKRSGLTKATVYSYVCWGWLPGPAKRIGNVNFFDPRKVKAFMEARAETAKPSIRKSVRFRKRLNGRKPKR